MCTCNPNSFSSWLKNNFEAISTSQELFESYKKIAELITLYYPNTKIWFAKRLGKRWSYIVGAGKESFVTPKKILLTENYAVFLQNFDDLYPKDKKEMITFLKDITTQKQNLYKK